MKIMNKILLVVLGMIAMATANAYQDECCPPVECPEPAPCCDIPAGPTTSAYNHPANIDVCGAWDCYVTGTFLWWQPIQGQMAYARTVAPAQSAYVSKIHEFHFKWKPGFKVGLGFNFNHDNWDLYFQYTRMYYTMTSTTDFDNTPGAYLESMFIHTSLHDSTLACTQAKTKWHTNFNIIDMELGRPYYNGKYLQFKAHYGLKGGWINQSLRANEYYLTTYYRDSKYVSKAWLIGPRAGIYTNWVLGQGFRFLGNAAVSLFYQKFHKVTLREVYPANPTQWNSAYDGEGVEYVSPALELLLGLGYGTYFDRNNWHFDLFAGYEVQSYFNQNAINALHQQDVLAANVGYNYLMFHGLNVTMKFDF